MNIINKQTLSILSVALLLSSPLSLASSEEGEPNPAKAKSCHLDGNAHIKHVPRSRQNHLEGLAHKLTLNEEQTTQFTALMQEQHEKRKASMEAFHQETKKLLSSILTEEQLTQFEKMRERHRMHPHKHEEKETSES